MKHFKLIITLVISVALLASCSTIKRWRGDKPDISTKNDVASSESIKTPTKEDYLSDLQEIIKNEIKSSSATNKNQVYRKRPYFWKNYSVYSNSDAPFDIQLQETDSKSKPYIAKIVLEKTLYYTRLHKNHRDAEEDNNYIRSIGKETLTYELRNGRWTKIGSVFVPDKTEKKINNEWVPLREEEIQKEQPEEPKKGWLNRIRSWIF
ncbi:MAG: hypothetical protein LDL53_07705 [Candidatus Hydrogenedens sp.]|nr:hypothetical protein [Candidatus Hydrogenedens sp.]